MYTIRFPLPPLPVREPLLCLHSSAGSGRQWQALTALLAPHFELLTPDRIGYGGTQRWPIDTPASLDDEAEHLAPLLAGNDGGVHLFGHSYGGAAALQIALRWPSRVKTLTLYEPVRFALLFGHRTMERAGQEILHISRRIRLAVLAGALHDAGKLFVEYWSGAGAWGSLSLRQQQALAERMPKVRAEFEATFADRVPASGYRALTMPVHLMTGTSSPLPAQRVIDVLAVNLPQANVVRLRGMGHMAPVSDADIVAGHLPAWLTRASAILAAP